MPYATPAQVRAVLIPDSTDPAGSPAELVDAVLAERVAAASAQVDAALSARYTVPFGDPCPRLVTDITVAIAGWLAALTYRRSVDVEGKDPVTLRYRWAADLLKALTAGTADLPEADAPPAAVGGGSVVNRQPTMFGLGSVGLTDRPSGRVRADRYPTYPWR